MIYVPFIYFLVLFLHFLIKKKCLDTGGMIVLIYLLGSLFSIFYYYTGYGIAKEFDSHSQFIPTLVYLSLLTISILPFYSFNSEKITLSDDLNVQRFKIVAYALLIFNIISITTNFDALVASAGEEFADTRSEAYKFLLNRNATRLSMSLWDYLVSFSSSFAPLLLLFYFYASIKNIGGSVLRILMLVFSLINVVLGILTASRTPIIYWIITFAVLYITFRHLIAKELKRKLIVVLIVLSIPVAIYFVAVTVSRFGEGTDAESSLVSYAGQTYPVFCELCHKYIFDGVTFDRLFPITTKYVFGNDFNMSIYRENVESRIGMSTGVFFTFLGDAIVDFGFLGVFIYTLFYVLLLRNGLRRKSNVVSLSYLIIMLLLVRQVSLGYFAYVYKSINTSVLIIGALIIAGFLKPKPKVNKQLDK